MKSLLFAGFIYTSIDLNRAGLHSERIFGLDLIRALAILNVAIVHSDFILEPLGISLTKIPMLDGVEMFFVLSGFLIGSILIKIFEKKTEFNFSVILNFLKRRWFRTLPNYYLVLLANIAVVYFGIIKEDYSQFNFKFFLFLQNFSSSFHGFFWESWSLSIEEWFYILFPFIILFFYLLFRRIVSKKTVVLISILAFLIVSVLLRFINTDNIDYWNGFRSRGIVIIRLDSIAFGILGAFIKAYYTNIWYRFKNSLFILGIAFSFYILFMKKAPDSVFFKTFDTFFLSLGVLMLLPKADSVKTFNNIFGKVITHISIISYSMYLLNFALIAEVISANFMPVTMAGAAVTYIIYWIILIVASTLMYKFYEKPIMDLRDKKFELYKKVKYSK